MKKRILFSRIRFFFCGGRYREVSCRRDKLCDTVCLSDVCPAFGIALGCAWNEWDRRRNGPGENFFRPARSMENLFRLIQSVAGSAFGEQF